MTIVLLTAINSDKTTVGVEIRKYCSLPQLVEEHYDRILLTMKEGTKVKIKGLVKNLFLNDKIGIFVKEASGDEERVGVEVVDPNGATTVLAVKIC